MLNSSRRLIGSQFFYFFYFIDWQSGGTGKQNISQQAFAESRKAFQSTYLRVMALVTAAKKKKRRDKSA